MRLAHDWFPRDLPANVALGERSWLYSAFAFLHYRSRRPCGVSIGPDSGVYNGSFFELGPRGEVAIGQFCAIVGAIIRSDARVAIGDYSFVAHEVVLADGDWDAPPGAGVREAGDPDAPPPLAIALGADVWVGARATLLGGTRVGDGAIVGAGAVVRGEVPPGAIVAGNPARVVGWAP